jgi:hypothetical protein
VFKHSSSPLSCPCLFFFLLVLKWLLFFELQNNWNLTKD